MTETIMVIDDSQDAQDFAPGIKQNDDLILFGMEYRPAGS